MSSIATTAQPEHASGRRRPQGRLRALPGAVICGAVVGVLQAMSPFGFWWLEPKTVYALGLALIAAVYIGFSVADGRGHVIAIGGSQVGLAMAWHLARQHLRFVPSGSPTAAAWTPAS
jgi:hypothetical protein